MDEKRCTGCLQILALTEFYKWNKGKDGLNCQCKKCSLSSVKKSRRKIAALKKGLIIPEEPILYEHNINALTAYLKKPIPLLIPTQIVDAIASMPRGLHIYREGEILTAEIRTKEGIHTRDLSTFSIRDLAHFLQTHKIRVIYE